MLKTQRLIGYPLQQEHFDLLQQMHNSPAVMATLGGVRTPLQTQGLLTHNLAHWKKHGFGLWIWRDLAGNFVGRAGLRKLELNGVNEIELAYALMPEFWNKGLATEIGKKLVEVAFTQLGITNLVCFTMPSNKGSERVMQKVGFVYEKDIVYKELPHVLYRLTKKQWLKNRK